LKFKIKRHGDLKIDSNIINTDRNILNSFLVEVFYQILALEEDALSAYADGKISSKEFHLIGAVFKGLQQGKNTMSDIAKMLNITTGSLTVSVTTLESKGYLARLKCSDDKRLVRIFPTHLAQEAQMYHNDFHHGMMKIISDSLNEEEISTVAKALITLKDFFVTASANIKKNKN